MPVPKRIVVVDDDAKVRQLIEYRLRAPEFQFFGFSDGREALARLQDIAPDLIVSDIMMPDLDGRLFFQAVRNSEALKHVPFVFVTAVRTDAVQQAVLDAGAKAFFVKPFPISQLVARIRTDLGLETGPGDAGASTKAMGVTPIPEAVRRQPEAPLPPPQAPPVPVVAAAPAPPVVASGPPAEIPPEATSPSATNEALPEASSEDFFDMLLEEAQAAAEATPLRVVASRGAGQAPPEGRSSTIDVRGKRVHIRTEVKGLPAFAVVTGVMRGDTPIARIETAWQHPLDRVEDRTLVKRQIDLQHHQAIGLVEDLVGETAPRRVLWGSQERSVDPAALCRAINSIREQLQARIGAPAALGLLRRSLAVTFQVRRILHCFHIRPDGSVWCDRGTTGVPHDALSAVAAWAWELILDAGRSSERSRDLDVRELTEPVADELERIGFYRAFDEVAESHRPVRRPAGVAVRSSFVSARSGPAASHDPGRPLAFPEPPPGRPSGS
jgi:CheY-like chemotaxis protein